MSLLNSHNWCEDAPDEPLFIKFSKIFEDKTLYGLNGKIRQFEAAHPHLKLVSSDDYAKKFPVFGNYLFSDKDRHYFELKYRYRTYKEVRYYELDPDLADWLRRIDEFRGLRRKKGASRYH